MRIRIYHDYVKYIGITRSEFGTEVEIPEADLANCQRIMDEFEAMQSYLARLPTIEQSQTDPLPDPCP